jgi:hypothetical protein
MKQRRQPGIGKHERSGQEGAAAELAITALTFIAEEPERLGRFLASSGIGPESLREAAGEPDFLLGVLDYVVGDEALLLEFAGHSAIDPTAVARARNVLAGETPQSG